LPAILPAALFALHTNPAVGGSEERPHLNRRIDELIAAHPGIAAKELFWETYKTVIRRGAEMMLPIWEASQGRYGFVSGQLDPRLLSEKDAMCRQAVEIAALGPNIMVKVPASCEGVGRALPTAKAFRERPQTCRRSWLWRALPGVSPPPKAGQTLLWRAVITTCWGCRAAGTDAATEITVSYHRSRPQVADWQCKTLLPTPAGRRVSEQVLCAVRQAPRNRQDVTDIECRRGRRCPTIPLR
jgi:hypothetical protein